MEMLRSIILERETLEELRITNCRMNVLTQEALLESLMESNGYNCRLKKLSLARTGLNNEKNLELMAEMITNSRYLIELDLSWNGLRPKNVGSLFNALVENA